MGRAMMICIWALIVLRQGHGQDQIRHFQNQLRTPGVNYERRPHATVLADGLQEQCSALLSYLPGRQGWLG